jgi:hypothetical protein
VIVSIILLFFSFVKVDRVKKIWYTDVERKLAGGKTKRRIFMINGLAIWHYPTRNDLENVRFFAENGFGAVSMHGRAMAKTAS